MTKYYGRVSLEMVDAGSKSERWAYMLASNDGKMRELRAKDASPFFNPDNSPFKQYIGKDVVIEAKPWKEGVIIVFSIKNFP